MDDLPATGMSYLTTSVPLYDKTETGHEQKSAIQQIAPPDEAGPLKQTNILAGR